MAFAVALATLQSSCATGGTSGKGGLSARQAAEGLDATRILSHEPGYAGQRPVTGLAIYVFVDVEPDATSPAFRQAVSDRFAEALARRGVRSHVVWFTDDPEYATYQERRKTAVGRYDVGVPVGKVEYHHLAEERSQDLSHRLVVFPAESSPGGRMNVKWDLVDVRNGNHEWTAWSHPPVLTANHPDDRAIAIADSFVDTMVAAMAEAHVIGADTAP